MPLVLSRNSGESVTLVSGGRVLGTIGVRCSTRAKLDFSLAEDIQIIRTELTNDKPSTGTEGRSNDDHD